MNNSNIQFFQDLLFLCRPKYKLFHIDTLQGYVVLYCQHLGNFSEFFKL
jgi:hypothetical protein